MSNFSRSQFGDRPKNRRANKPKIRLPFQQTEKYSYYYATY